MEPGRRKDFSENRSDGPRELTRLLNQASAGDSNAQEVALSAVYARLRELAGAHVSEKQVTLQPTVLIHEAYIRLFQDGSKQWGSSGQFYAMAAKAMRHIAVDYARRRQAEKRGAGWSRVTIAGVESKAEITNVEILELHEALNELASLSPRQASIVEMRFFGDMSNVQIAESLAVSERTVQLEWRAARAWIRSFLDRGDSG